MVLKLPWLVLMMPLFGFIVLALFGGKGKELKQDSGFTLIACLCVLVSFMAAVGTFWGLHHMPATGVEEAEHASPKAQPSLCAARDAETCVESYNWIDIGGFTIPFALLIDPLSSLLMLVITGIGFLIHMYSLGYMSHDEDRIRYFSYLNLFTFFMLVLVMGSSLALMFVGWEGVGLCSYLLIGFWFKKKSASDAGKKAFIMNRVGDAGLIMGMAIAYWKMGTLDLVELSRLGAGQMEALGVIGPFTLLALALFVGACGKSAQIPLQTWLPDAMEGPTPVSALIHAATMVTAGVYMVSRLGTVYAASKTALLVVGTIGALTALIAATIALVQTDIKKVLAYSTVSQLGYMFLACGVGAFGVGVFHLYTHAFFKALLFLGSGSVIHALSGEQDMRQMGGLRKKIPWTFATFFVGWLAIIGTPFFSGFFSKDEILLAAFDENHGNKLLFAMALVTAGLTAFYMSRLFFMTFFGEYRGALEKGHASGHDAHASHATGSGDAHNDHGHAHGHGGIHESPAVMLIPLFVLAIGSVLAGYVNVPHMVEGAIRVPLELAHISWMPLLATGVAIVGVFFAYVMYLGAWREVPAKLASRFPVLKDLLESKWGFDDAYDSFAANPVNGVVATSERELWKKVDAGWIDGTVNGIGRLFAEMATGARMLQSGLVRGSALSMLAGAVALLSAILWMAN